MKISHDDVLKVAELARLRFEPREVDRFTDQLSDILDYVDKLAELDLEGVEPTAHVHDIVNAFRTDEVRPSMPNAEGLAGAPDAADGCFKVLKVIEEG